MNPSAAPTTILRGDATGRIGAGHVARLAGVAAALGRRALPNTLVATGVPPGVADRLDLRRIDPGWDPERDPEVELPADAQQRDARATLAAAPSGPAAVLVDHYGLGAAWQEAIRTVGVSTVAAIDDLPGRPHAADLLIDPNPGSADEGPVPVGGGRVLRGPAYAPLGAEYRDVAPRAVTDGPHRVLVTLGGGASGVAARIAAGLRAEPALDGVDLVFVVPDDAERAEVLAILHGRPRSEAVGRVPSLVGRLARSDLVLSAGGSTSWQRLRLGVPGVMLALAPNQVRVCRTLAAAGLGRWVEGDLDGPRIARAVAEALEDGAGRDRARTVGPLLVDGRGADRVALALHRPASGPALRPAVAQDASALLTIANDPDTRRGSRDPRPIEPMHHLRWLAERLADPSSLQLVAACEDLVVGQVRFDRLVGSGGAETWEMSYALEAAARGNRWADPMLAEGVRTLRIRRPDAAVVAVVGDGNPRSHAAFRRLGFESDPLGSRAAALGARVGPGFAAYLLDARSVPS